jgi:hypothetical protein
MFQGDRVGAVADVLAAIDWYDWLTKADTVVAIPVAAVGFALTIWQIVRTRRAVDAARAAVSDVQRTLARNHLLVLLPQLQRVEQDLEVAIGNSDIGLVGSYLGTWRWQAGQLRGLLQADATTNKRLLRAIQQSIALAATAKLDLLEKQSDLL